MFIHEAEILIMILAALLGALGGVELVCVLRERRVQRKLRRMVAPAAAPEQWVTIATGRVEVGKKYRFIAIHGGDEFDIEEDIP